MDDIMDQRAWFARRCRTWVEDVSDRAQCRLGGSTACAVGDEDPAVRRYAHARMDLLVAGSRVTINSRGSERQAAVLQTGDSIFWSQDAWSAEGRDRSADYLGLVFARNYLRMIKVHIPGSGRIDMPSVVHHTARPMPAAAWALITSMRLLAGQAQGDPGLDRYLSLALVSMVAAHLEEDDGEPAKGAHATWLQLQHLCQDHLAEPIDRHDLALQLGITAHYISELCTRFHGAGFRDLLTQLRIDQACRLLQQRPRLKVQLVARQCGFADPSYFTKVFKARMGQSPAAYRA